MKDEIEGNGPNIGPAKFLEISKIAKMSAIWSNINTLSSRVAKHLYFDSTKLILQWKH